MITLKELLIKIFHRHDYQSFKLPNGNMSKQFGRCWCGKEKEVCKHEYTKPYDHYPTSIRYNENEELKLSCCVKNVKRCVKCGKLEHIYTHQW